MKWNLFVAEKILLKAAEVFACVVNTYSELIYYEIQTAKGNE